MIVSSPLTDNISKVDLSSDTYQLIREGIEQKRFNEDEKFGFVPESVGTEQTSAFLVIRTPTKIREFNPQTEDVEERTTEQTDLIPFRVDFHSQLLEVFSNKEDVQKVELRLGQVADWDISISDPTLDLPRIYEKLQSTVDDIRFKSLKIKDYAISENARGTYHPQIFDQQEATRLIDKHQDGLTYFAAEFGLGQEEVTVGFYQTGSVQIYNKTDQTGELLEIIKAAIMKVENDA